MIDEIDFFDRRSGSRNKKAGEDWNELKKLKKKQNKPAPEPDKKDPAPPSAGRPAG